MAAKNTILLIGTGQMAIDYAKVLTALKQEVIVVGRGEASAKNFTAETGLPVVTGGINRWLAENKERPDKAIVAVTENELGNVALALLKNNFKDILVEKPGGFDYAQIKELAQTAKTQKAKVYVGYNRRFYAATLAAEKIIKADGGVTSFNFEFTEWSHKLVDLVKAPGIKERWYLHNSTHVIDLAFFLGGEPDKLSAYTAGGLSWHPSASIFAGAGVTKNGALFSYQANWEAPGRWSVEILTKKHRLIFRPMEKLQIQQIGSVAIEEEKIYDNLDTTFKPGLHQQVEAFLNDERERFCSIEDQMRNLEYYKIIAGAKSGL